MQDHNHCRILVVNYIQLCYNGLYLQNMGGFLRFIKVDVINKDDYSELKLLELSVVKGVYSLVGQKSNSIKYSNQSFIFDTSLGMTKDKALEFIKSNNFTIGATEELDTLQFDSLLTLRADSVEEWCITPDYFRKQKEKQDEVYALKVSDERRIVRGVVYAPNVADAHDEYMEPEEIVKASERFMLASQKVDSNHNFVAGDGHPVENFIARKNDPDGFPEGAWIMGIKVVDNDMWAKVKSGKIRAFSWAGMVEFGDKKEVPSNWVNDKGERVNPYNGK